MGAPRVRHTVDGPSESITDRAAADAFDAIDHALRGAGQDPDRTYALVMVMIPNGQPKNATVAAHMPGEPTTQRMLEHALTQLEVIAKESGYAIRLESING